MTCKHKLKYSKKVFAEKQFFSMFVILVIQLEFSACANSHHRSKYFTWKIPANRRMKSNNRQKKVKHP